MVKKFSAELVGTMVLVLFGCGAAVLGPAPFDQLAVSLAFGFAIVAMAYGIGPVSGCHVNPAVSFAAFMAGRMSARDMLVYWVAQVIGALIGAFILSLIAKTGMSNLGQNGWGPGYLGEYGMHAALIFEVVMTAIFVVVILGVTGEKAHGPFAGVAIGITLAVIHIVGIQVTGVSVNPARSFGPAVLAGGTAIGQLWLFIVAPLVGAAIGGLLFRLKVLDPDA
ncbi:Aquaporin Z 2 [Brevundimonas sp. NIBR10]|uniref:aquaporin n=1 Tax=Brevundimonas sp. NIBR10 TaxID=3015997 RepID=UPI0022F17888|nr:aquaporin [Brevundimonas sp. NIBR10]WGM47773.1 Aquaporin Z 2 [Brevundimonas sp. NIBR10]